jgi:uncharacterized protein (DUF305 family)
LLAAGLALGGCAAAGMPGMGQGNSAVEADANATDVMFTQMMIPHHEQAIEMSDMLLAKDGIDDRVTALAEDIKAAQQPEIDQMEAWLEEWGMDMPGMDAGGHGSHGGGMMSEEDMQALDEATGVEASRLFLEQMIEHHEGAIDMAEDVVENGSNADVIALAESIVASQTAEIELMRELLRDL